MNFYKISTFVLLLALLLALYWIFSAEKPPKEKSLVNGLSLEDVQEDYRIFDELFNDLGGPSTGRIDSTAGRFYTRQVAQDKIDSFTVYNNQLSRKIQPYAFSFGTVKLKKLLQDIDAFNRQYPNRSDTNRVVGTRIYLSLSRTGGREPKTYIDMTLVPVRQSGRDFLIQPPIFGEDQGMQMKSSDAFSNGDGFFLNTSSPCPTYCNP